MQSRVLRQSEVVNIVYDFFILLFIYCLIPGLPKSGLLLDKTQPTYIGKLFGTKIIFIETFANSKTKTVAIKMRICKI